MTNLEDPVIASVERWWEALSKGNWAVIGKLTAEPFVCFSEEGELQIQGKKELLDAAGTIALSRLTRHWLIEEPRVEHLDGASICTYRWVAASPFGGDYPAFQDTATDVLVKEGQNWLIVAHHGGLVLPAWPVRNDSRLPRRSTSAYAATVPHRWTLAPNRVPLPAFSS